jgi:hypothetical protein
MDFLDLILKGLAYFGEGFAKSGRIVVADCDKVN